MGFLSAVLLSFKQRSLSLLERYWMSFVFDYVDMSVQYINTDTSNVRVHTLFLSTMRTDHLQARMASAALCLARPWV